MVSARPPAKGDYRGTSMEATCSHEGISSFETTTNSSLSRRGGLLDQNKDVSIVLLDIYSTGFARRERGESWIS